MFSISNWNFNWWWAKPVALPPCDPNKTYIDNSRTRFLKLLAEGRGSSSNLAPCALHTPPNNSNASDSHCSSSASSNIDSLVYNKKAFFFNLFI